VVRVVDLEILRLLCLGFSELGLEVKIWKMLEHRVKK